MIIYGLLYIVLIGFSLTSVYLHVSQRHFVFVMISMVLVFFVGMRFQVGPDWSSYQTNFSQIKDSGLSIKYLFYDPAYNLINWLVGSLGLPFYLVNIFSAVVFVYGLYVFLVNERAPFLGLCVAYPYLVLVVGMSFTPQSAALGLVMLAFTALARNQGLKTFALIVLAAMFHFSAAGMLFILLALSNKSKLFYVFVWTAALVAPAAVLYMIQDYLLAVYVSRNLSSEAALVRALMNALPALTWLFLRLKIYGDEHVPWMWNLLAGASLVLAISVPFVPFNTILDRFGIYFIPIQIHIATLLATNKKVPLWDKVVFMIAIFYVYMLVFFVYFYFGLHADSLMPYQIV